MSEQVKCSQCGELIEVSEAHVDWEDDGEVRTEAVYCCEPCLSKSLVPAAAYFGIPEAKMAKTREEVDELKKGWVGDPCWDIEETEGFEEYRVELLQFRLGKEWDWKQQQKEQVRLKAVKLGCSWNLVLAEYVILLESKLEAIERRLEKLEGH